MADNLLILHPRDAHSVPADPEGLLRQLNALGFTGEAFSFAGAEHLRPGPEFLYLLSFLGCSPVVSLGSPGATGEDFCHIEPGHPHHQPQLLYGSNVKQPRCRSCGQRVEDWQDLLQQWAQAPQRRWDCPACGQTHRMDQLKWRQSAGLARYFIKVWGIYEGEAVPTEQLLGALHRQSGQEWTYFYLRRDAATPP